MKSITIALFVLSMSLSIQAYAHTSLASSMPKDNAMLMESPDNLALNFADDVRLVDLKVKSKKGELVDVGFEPSMDANKNYSFSLPLLAVDTYVVSWTIMGDDGHKMKGQLSFMVHVSKKMKGMKHKDMKNTSMDHSGMTH
ncbi:copper resistance CopC family protein [Alteromonas sp. A079]|uniref:copper resistance CopC family protein n=1 Tax=Alteromonas sp. A079 TaxID=3410268 RepID=UPI003BA12524